MKLNIKVSKEYRFVYARYVGKVDLVAFRECTMLLLSYRNTDTKYDGLIDLRNASLDMGYEKFKALGYWLGQEGAWFNGRWAAVVNSDVDFGKFRIWMALSENCYADLRVFHDEEQALMWTADKENQ